MLRQLLVLTALCGIAMPAALVPRVSHRITFVAIGPDVRLEVLDWGGRGPALIFLAGFGNTGHVFDSFAPAFTNRYRVLAITRRGFGASSHPPTGYNTGTLVKDIMAVLDSLGIRRASFVGHSFAGTELTFLGARHAERVAALIYLDASYDFARLYADPRWQRAFPIPRPPAPTTTDIPAWRRWFASVMGPGVSDDEIRNLTSSGTAPSLDTILRRGAAETELAGIKEPVLALWAVPRSVEDWYPYWASLDSLGRSRLQVSFDDQAAVRRTHWQTFREKVPGARVVSLAGARHYIFLTHPRQVAAAMRAFLTSREPQPNER